MSCALAGVHARRQVIMAVKERRRAMAIAPLIAALLFAAIFVCGRWLHVFGSRRVAISFGAGVATAYVFIQMLPEMDEAGSAFVQATARRGLPMPELRIYASALTGFILFYGLANLVAWSRQQAQGEGAAGDHLSAVFGLHIAGFALYAWTVGYLMVRGISAKPTPIALYAVAMALHFIGVDGALRREHGAIYDRVGRFVLAGAALAGWGVAILTDIPKPIIITGFGLVSGGVVMNSMIMELPRDKDGRFWPFVFGATGYAVLLALIR